MFKPFKVQTGAVGRLLLIPLSQINGYINSCSSSYLRRALGNQRVPFKTRYSCGLLFVGRSVFCVCDYASLFARSTVLPLEVPRRLTQRSPNNAAAPCARGRRLGRARPGPTRPDPLPPGGAAWAGSSSVLVLGGHRLQSWCLGGPPQAVRRLALIRVVAPAPSCSAVVKIQTS